MQAAFLLQVSLIVPIEGKIYMIRGHKVMLSTDLAELYEVQPKVLMQAVKRNIERLPSDFMFMLSHQEFVNLTIVYM